MTDISIISLSNPTSSDTLNSATTALKHATQHSNANDQIERIETYLWSGVTGSLPMVRAIRSTNQSLTDNTDTVITFPDSEDFDTDTMHSLVSNQGRITFTTAGVYVIGADVTYAANATGPRATSIKFNGTTVLDIVKGGPAPSGSTSQFVSAALSMSAGQYVEAIGYQNSTVSLNVTAARFWAVRVG